LRDFRSYGSLELELEPGVVLVTGANGAGKTNLLEGLHVGTQGFSPRARNDAQLVRFGAQTARVQLAGSRAGRPVQVDVMLAAAESRRARLTGSALRSAEELRSALQTLVFTPDRLAVVKGGPAARRAYLDRSIGRLFPSRLRLPAEYATALGQRNAALRRVAAGSSSREALTPWTSAVVELGTALVELRQETLALLSPRFEQHAGRLALPSAGLAYDGEAPTIEELEGRLDRDLERGTTGFGPHLHEIRIETAGRDLRSFGSQGEQRIAVLALVLAEADLITERVGAAPLVLLDDVLSELDGDRRLALCEHIRGGGQTLVTATAAAALPDEPAQSLFVTPGHIRAV
jgi:DNA replication and repair protein RecF